LYADGVVISCVLKWKFFCIVNYSEQWRENSALQLSERDYQVTAKACCMVTKYRFTEIVVVIIQSYITYVDAAFFNKAIESFSGELLV
jgi:hypothetical protein